MEAMEMEWGMGMVDGCRVAAGPSHSGNRTDGNNDGGIEGVCPPGISACKAALSTAQPTECQKSLVEGKQLAREEMAGNSTSHEANRPHKSG
jgi:hypothetical protein